MRIFLCLIAIFAIVLFVDVFSLSAAQNTREFSVSPSQFGISFPVTDTASARIYLPLVMGVPPPRLLIAAAYIDSPLSGEPDEALMLWNTGGSTQALAGWQLATATRRATFPLTSTLQLAAGQRLWCTAQATAFQRSFGEKPLCEWAADTDPAVLNLDGKLTFANSGGRIQLLNALNQVIDTLLYGKEEQPAHGWIGVAAQLYTRGLVPAVGQVWQRKIDPQVDAPIDSDQAIFERDFGQVR